MVISPYIESLLIMMGINIILALGCYFGISVGMNSLGHAGFMALGAYIAAFLTTTAGIPFGFALVLGGIGASILGVLIAIFCLRTKGIYLVLMTWAFAEVIAVFFLNFEYTGGVGGFYGILPKTNIHIVYGILAGVCFLFWRLESSSVGLVLRAVREDDEGSKVMGVDTSVIKTFAFGGGAFITGVGGGLYAHYALYIEPMDFGLPISAFMLLSCILGGTGVFIGPLVGASIFTILPEVLRIAEFWRMVSYGACILLILIFRRRGLLTQDDIRSLKNWFKFKKEQRR